MSEKKFSLTPRVMVQLLVVIVLIPLFPLLLSGRWSWWQGWAYASIAVFGFLISRGVAARVHPDLLHERARFSEHEDIKEWDKPLSRLMGYGAGLLPVVIGLEHRFGAAGDFGLAVNLIGLGLLLSGYALGTWALTANRFFSGVVRIQKDRNHQVVRHGPYRIVRHPGYLGALVSYLGTPLLLDGRWAFLAVLLLLVVTGVRTRLEDRTLQEELDGYRDYTRKVRFRLIPGVW